jgi:uncharacterized protein (DUF433 family)
MLGYHEIRHLSDEGRPGMTTIQATEQIVDIGQMIVTSPDIRRGRPRMAGTGVTVQSIVGLFKLGLSPEEIADEFGHLSLAQVYAGLAYYHANREQIEAAIAADRLEAEKLEQKHAGSRRLAA